MHRREDPEKAQGEDSHLWGEKKGLGGQPLNDQRPARKQESHSSLLRQPQHPDGALSASLVSLLLISGKF